MCMASDSAIDSGDAVRNEGACVVVAVGDATQADNSMTADANRRAQPIKLEKPLTKMGLKYD